MFLNRNIKSQIGQNIIKLLKAEVVLILWLTDVAIEKWYEDNQDNIGCGAPQEYTDFAITVCHEIRQVYKGFCRKLTIT